MKSLSKDRLEKIASWRETYGAEHNVVIPASEADAMASELLYRRAGKAEPVAWRRVNSGYVTLSDVIAEDWMRQGFLVSPLYEWANVPAVCDDEARESLYKIANHIASAKNGMPSEWQDWAEEIEGELRQLAECFNK